MTRAKQDKPQKSVLYQLELKAYPMRHTWMITVHISICNLNKQLGMLNCQKTLVHELLMKLQCIPFTSNFVFNALLGELSNIDNIYHIYHLYEPTIWTAVQLLRTEPVIDKINNLWKPMIQKEPTTFLGDALHWLLGMATMKDPMEIKPWVDSLIKEQIQQQETLVHGTCHLHLKHHKIYQQGKHTEAKWGNGCPPEG